MPRDVENVVDTAHDADVALIVRARTIAGEVILAVEVLRVVALPEALRIAPDAAQHAGPGLLDDELAALALAGGGPVVLVDLRHDAGERPVGRARLEGHRARQRRDQDAAGLGLPPGVHDRQLVLADVAVVPHPGLGVDRLAHRAEDAQARKVVLSRVGVPVAFVGLDQRADRRRRGVEDRDLVLVADLPEAIRARMTRYALENHRRRAVGLRDRQVGDRCDRRAAVS